MYPMGAGEPRRGIIRRTTGAVAAADAVVMFGGSMAASRGRHVDETEIPQNENLEVEVSEGHDDGDRRMNHGGVSDPKVRTERSNQLLDEEGLFAKTTKDLTAPQLRREESAAGRKTSVGRRIRATTPWHETPRRRKRGCFFLSWCNRAPRERKEAGTMPSAAKGAASPWFDGEGSKTC
jgi:hypothetical protein